MVAIVAIAVEFKDLIKLKQVNYFTNILFEIHLVPNF